VVLETVVLTLGTVVEVIETVVMTLGTVVVVLLLLVLLLPCKHLERPIQASLDHGRHRG
jgi:hypothetical protein